MAWFAIPTEDSERVLKAFGLKDTTIANWETGIDMVYSHLEFAFITPPVDGWTFVLGLGLPSFDTEESTGKLLALIETLGALFPDFYYFGTHRVVEFHAWVRISKGKIERAYAYLGERGETLYETGAQTKEETALGFEFFDERSPEAAAEGYFDRNDLRFPDEEDVMRISAAWTTNTQTLDQRTETDTGFLARIN